MVVGTILLLVGLWGWAAGQQHIQHHHFLRNTTLGGFDRGCVHSSTYFVTPHIQFPMCMGQTDQDLKNGMSIINLIRSRGFLPTCRVLHFLLWMHGSVHDRNHIPRDLFVDVGSNIGYCIAIVLVLSLSPQVYLNGL